MAKNDKAVATEADREQAAAALVNAFSRQLSTLALGIHEAASNIDAVAKQVERQEAQLKRLRESAQAMAETNRQIDSATEIADRAAEAGQAELMGSRRAVGSGIIQVATLVDAVERMEQRLDGIATSLKGVAGISGSIDAIARQTRSCPMAWCRSSAPRRAGPPYQVARAGKLTGIVSLTAPNVSRLM